MRIPVLSCHGHALVAYNGLNLSLSVANAAFLPPFDSIGSSVPHPTEMATFERVDKNHTNCKILETTQRFVVSPWQAVRALAVIVAPVTASRPAYHRLCCVLPWPRSVNLQRLTHSMPSALTLIQRIEAKRMQPGLDALRANR